jgi:hypothetical protein
LDSSTNSVFQFLIFDCSVFSDGNSDAYDGGGDDGGGDDGGGDDGGGDDGGGSSGVHLRMLVDLQL